MSGSISALSSKVSIDLVISPAAALVLATSLVNSIVSGAAYSRQNDCFAGYQLLCQLAMADVQAGNERLKGVAGHVATSTLQVTCCPPVARFRRRWQLRPDSLSVVVEADAPACMVLFAFCIQSVLWAALCRQEHTGIVSSVC